ncbi:MAG: hypothetical protein ACO3B3_05970 [Cyanobium sp.]
MPPRPSDPYGFDDTKDRTPAGASAALPSSRPSRRLIDLGMVLRWIGLALLGIYLVTVIAAALPVKLLDPAWINRICGSIRGGVSFPLEALALLLIDAYLCHSGREPALVTDFRRLCSWVAVGFVLMIPLQTWASQKLIVAAVDAQKARLEPAENAIKAVYAATDAEQLLAAIQRIPGAPPNIGGRFEEPVPKVRERLIAQIEPQVRQRQAELKQLIGSIRSEGLTAQIKDGLVAFFSSLAFAAIGRSKPGRRTLLNRLIMGAPASDQASGEFERLAESYKIDPED